MYNITINNKTYDVIPQNGETPTGTINGAHYDLAVKKISEIKSPMPGLVLDILVKAGDTIKKGDQVLVLEAMKMENIIKSQTDAVVKSVAIETGVAVEKGQVLIKFE